MASTTHQNDYIRPVLDYGELPETPPAHIWALKALRNQLLGTRPSPMTTTTPTDDEIDELTLPPQSSPLSPSKAGILKTPGTITRRKSVTFNKNKPPEDPKVIQTPQQKRQSILSRNFPGKYPSPYTPRTRQCTPEIPMYEGDTDLIPVSRSAIETLTGHVDLVLDNNTRLQQIISSGELYKDSYGYSAHPDLATMKRELEREKEVLKKHFADFEQQQRDIKERERELNVQYTMLSRQMEEQYALQSSTAKIVEDYQDTIQNLNHTISEERESHQRELGDLKREVNGYEDKVNDLQAQLDEAKDMIRGNRAEIEEREYAIAEYQEKLKKTQRQLSHLKMETLESRVGPNTTKDGEGHRIQHRRTTSRKVVSATYNTTAADKAPEFFKDPVPAEVVTFKPDDISNKILSPKSNNIEEEGNKSKAPGQDAIARRAAAAKRLEERQRIREKGKENCWM